MSIVIYNLCNSTNVNRGIGVLLLETVLMPYFQHKVGGWGTFRKWGTNRINTVTTISLKFCGAQRCNKSERVIEEDFRGKGSFEKFNFLRFLQIIIII